MIILLDRWARFCYGGIAVRENYRLDETGKWRRS